MPAQLPPALDTVTEHIAENAETYEPGRRWPQYSEEWYWEVLVVAKPFRSVYEEGPGPGSTQPLISRRPTNLSQTPREQCELEGLVAHGRDRQGPGQVGR